MSAEHQDNIEKSVCDEASRRARRMIDDGIDSIGGMVVAAGLCGMDRGDLRKSLDQNGRRFALDHAIAIGARLRQFNATLATKIGAAIVLPFDLVVFPRVTLTDKERADRYERLIRSMPMGDVLVERALETP